MESQEQCDRMKKLCIDNNLPIWKWKPAFELTMNKVFEYDSGVEKFYCNSAGIEQETKVTEEQFIELLKNRNHA